MSYNREYVSKEIAEDLLKNHNHNNARPMTPANTDYFVRLIMNDEFMTTHQGICIGKDGEVLDGQHRLAAIVITGKGQWMYVMRGGSPEIAKHTDRGRNRTSFECLKLLNDPAHNRLCNQIVSQYLKCTGVHHRPTIDELEDTFLKMSASFEFVTGKFNTKRARLTRATIAAAMVVFHHFYPRKAEEFIDSYLAGTDLPEGSPILVLRNAVLGDRIGSGSSDNYWNCTWAIEQWREDKSVKRLFSATEDLLGNTRDRMIDERSASARKGAKTKQKKQAVEEVNLKISKMNEYKREGQE
jgi:hypothetical protein